MRESRLTRRTVKQSKKQLYTYLIATVVIIFVALKFGPFLIGAAGGFIDKITGKKAQQELIVSDADVLPPELDPLPEATPSSRIKVTGRSSYQNGKVELFVNGTKQDTTDIDEQTFEFEDVRLSSGDNDIKARVVINDKKSDFSEEETITYSKEKPKLEVSSPSDGQKFSKGDQQITVSGTTDPDNSVDVNGFVAIVNSEGNFSYNLKLSNGDNKIKITATSPAGQQESKELTVSYSE